jgi:hypothetical protein
MTARLVSAVIAAALLTGCSIRVQAPVREVAYDFSDADFYDRAYGPSPDWRGSEAERAPAPVARRAAPAGVVPTAAPAR